MAVQLMRCLALEVPGNLAVTDVSIPPCQALVHLAGDNPHPFQLLRIVGKGDTGDGDEVTVSVLQFVQGFITEFGRFLGFALFLFLRCATRQPQFNVWASCRALNLRSKKLGEVMLLMIKSVKRFLHHDPWYTNLFSAAQLKTKRPESRIRGHIKSFVARA